jgi:hypothetical protein
MSSGGVLGLPLLVYMTSPPPPLLTQSGQSHLMGMGFQCGMLTEKCKPGGAPGANGVSKEGGGETTQPETSKLKTPPEDMEPFAPGVLPGHKTRQIFRMIV